MNDMVPVLKSSEDDRLSKDPLEKIGGLSEHKIKAVRDSISFFTPHLRMF